MSATDVQPQQLLAELEKTGNLSIAGLILPPDITPERYEAIGVLLYQWGEARRWVVGDWLIQGHAIFGDAFYEYSEVLQMSVRSRQQYMRVAERIPPGKRRRVPELRWSHHRAVASLEPEDADRWLQRAIDERWTKAELEDALKGVIPTLPPLAFQATNYVVERVLSAAEQVYASRKASDNPDYFLVEARAMHDLADALGVEKEMR